MFLILNPTISTTFALVQNIPDVHTQKVKIISIFINIELTLPIVHGLEDFEEKTAFPYLHPSHFSFLNKDL